MTHLSRLPSLLALAVALSLGHGAAQTFPQTVRHEAGQTTLSTAPKRIVVLEYALADDLTALGIKPVGWAREADVPSYLVPQMGAATNIGTRAQPSLEKILALKPDLILADSTRHKELYAQLSRIAPTLLLNVFRSDYPQQLDAFATLGQAVGKKAQADKLIAAQQELVKKAKLTANRKAGGVLVAAVPPSGLFLLHSRESTIGGLVEAMGRHNLASAVGHDDSLYPIDLEEVVRVNPEAIALLVNAGEKTVMDTWKNNPLWTGLSAVKNKHVYVFDRDLWSKARGIQALALITRDAVRSGFLQDTPTK